MRVIEYVVDTNFLLQCKNPEELPWGDVTDANTVVLLVPRVVQREVDRLKSDGKGRRSKRARDASALLRKAACSSDDSVDLRASKPTVRLIVLRRLQNRPVVDGLDPQEADDSIVLDVMALRSAGHESACLLTGDSGPILTAKHQAVPFVAVPKAWLLPAESDGPSKALAELRQRVRALESVRPAIQLSFRNNSRETIDRLLITVVEYRQNEAALENALTRIEARWPMVEDYGVQEESVTAASILQGSSWRNPTAQEIEEYRTRLYPNWLREVRSYLERALQRAEEMKRRDQVVVALANDGACPAERLLVEVEILGEPFELFDPDDANAQGEEAPWPSPPEAPRGRRVTVGLDRSILDEIRSRPPDFAAILSRQLPVPPSRRDPHTFYWSTVPSAGNQSWRLECEDLRHQREPIEISVGILAGEGCTNEEGAVRVRVSAANMAQRVEQVLPLRVELELRDASECLEPRLTALLSSDAVAGGDDVAGVTEWP